MSDLPVNWPNALDAKPVVPEFMNQEPQHPELLDFILTLLMVMETELGVNPSGAWASVKDRLDAIMAGGAATTFTNLWVSGYLRAGTDNASPGWQLRETAGTLNANGYAALAHNTPDLPRRLLLCQAWYQGSGGEVKFINNIIVDGIEIHCNYNTPVADAANRRVKVGWVYTENPVPW